MPGMPPREHAPQGVIWTIGHSTRTAGEFLDLLSAHGIGLVADVRSAPSSARCPQHGKDALRLSLAAAGIRYVHLPLLGGHRAAQRGVPAGLNGAWRNASFRNYADYATGQPFASGLARLQALAAESRVACMCAEAVPWRCHRTLISDHLALRGWQVLHVTSMDAPGVHVPGGWGGRPVLRDGTVTYPAAHVQPALPFGAVA